MINPTQDL